MLLKAVILVLFGFTLYAQEAHIGFLQTARKLSELSGKVEVIVARSGNTNAVHEVHFQTAHATAEPVSDFQESSGTVAFALGETNKIIFLTIVDDDQTEAVETFSIRLEPIDGVTLAEGELQISILDNDAGWSGLMADFHFAATNTVGINALLLNPDRTFWFGGEPAGVVGGYGLATPSGSLLTREHLNLLSSKRVLSMAFDREGGAILALDGFSVGRYSGDVDPNFISGRSMPGKSIAAFPQPDGRIALLGSFGPETNATGFHIVDAYNLPVSYDPDASRHIRFTSAVQTAPELLIAGWDFTNGVSGVESTLGRWLLNGTRDLSFQTPLLDLLGKASKVTALSLHPSKTKVLAAIRTQTEPGPVTQIFQMDLNGAADKNSPLATIEGVVHVIAFTTEFSAEGAVSYTPVYGGEFTSVNGTAFNNVSGIPPAEGPNGPVYAIVEEASGTLLIGGHFTEFSGLKCNGLVRIRGGQAEPQRQYVFWENSQFHGFEKLESLELKLARAGAIESQLPLSLKISGPPGSESLLGLPLNSGLPIIFQPGEGEKIIHVPLNNNTAQSGKLHFELELTTSAANTHVSRPGAELILFDDETPESPDPLFPREAHLPVHALARQADGKILLGYWSNGARIARLNHDGTKDPSFRTNQLPNWSPSSGYIEQIQEGPDGKIYVAGTFRAANTFSTNTLARLNHDGTLDSSFNPRLNVNGFSHTSVRFCPQADGKIVIASSANWGTFASHQQSPINRGLLRLMSDGTLDASFGESLGGSRVFAQDIEFDSNGKILVAGILEAPIRNSGLHRFTSDGRRDNTYTLILNGMVYEMIRDGTSLLVVGRFNRVNERVVSNIVKLNLLNDTVDEGFNAVVDSTISQALLLEDRRILIAGDFTKVNGVDRFRIAILHPDGSLDQSFDPRHGLNYPPSGLAQLLDGRIVVGGAFSKVDGALLPYLVRFEGSKSRGTLQVEPESVQISEKEKSVKIFIKRFGGSEGTVSGSSRTISQGAQAGRDFVAIDSNFQFADGQAEILSIEVPLIYNPLFTGSQSFAIRIVTGAMEKDVNVVLLDAENGIVLPDFLPELTTSVQPAITDFFIAPSGEVLVTGHFHGIGGNPITNVALFNSNLELISSFAPKTAANRPPMSAVLDTQGGVLLGGDFTTVGLLSLRSLARLQSDLSLDLQFAQKSVNTANWPILGFLRVADDKFIGFGPNIFRRWNSDGSRDEGFASAVTGATAAALYTNGSIVLGRGGFNSLNQVEANGTLHPSKTVALRYFSGGAPSPATARAIAPLPNGKLLIGGDFNQLNGIAAGRISRLNSDWSIDPTFNHLSVGTNGMIPPFEAVNAILPLPNGEIIIGGRFKSVAGQPRELLALLGPDGELQPGFSHSIKGTEIHELGLLPSGDILVRGNVTNVNGVAVPGLFRLQMALPRAPVISFTSPNPGAILETGKPITITAEAFDPDGRLDLVELIVDGSTNQFQTGPYRVTLQGLSLGEHTIHARARDASGSQTEATPLVFVVQDAAPPELRLSAQLSAGQLTFSFEADGSTYILESTEDLKSWDEVHTFVAVNGHTTFTLSASPQGHKFYRLLRLPPE